MISFEKSEFPFYYREYLLHGTKINASDSQKTKLLYTSESGEIYSYHCVLQWQNLEGQGHGHHQQMEPAWVLNCRAEEEEMNCQSQQQSWSGLFCGPWAAFTPDELKEILLTTPVGALSTLPQMEIVLCKLSTHRLVSALQMLARGFGVLGKVPGEQIRTHGS